MKRVAILGAVGMLAILLGGGLTPAQAGSCLGTETQASPCVIELTNTNISSGLTLDVRVSIYYDGTNTNITVSYVSSNLTNTIKGISEIGFQFSSPSTITNITSGYSASVPNGNFDGFGSFTAEVSAQGNNILPTFSFSLPGTVTVFAENDTTHHAEFTAHVQFNSSSTCSAFVSDGTSNATSSLESGCTTVPEPSTLPLLGVSLIGISLCWRKISRLRSASPKL